jgi:hypothetical protein
MKLKEYIETVQYPKLSYHINYSDFFEKQYSKFQESTVPISKSNYPISFYCRRDEYDEFIELLKSEKLTYNDKIVGKDDNYEYLIEFSEFFEKGFDSINYNTPASVIISNIPFCSTIACIYPENNNKGIVCLGRKNSKSKPCIVGMRPVSADSFFGQGLLRSKKINNVTKERVLRKPQKVAFEEGVMYKSIIQVIERYPEFESYFTLVEEHSENFEEFLIRGIRELQVQDVKCEGIRIIKEDNKSHKEEPFRDWFKTYIKGKYFSANAEPIKGNGRIDLKVEDTQIGTKILELKGWWNNDKNMLPKQIMNYLTDFEDSGYILMINHCKEKRIDNDYLELMKTNEMGYVPGSFEEKEYHDTGYKYYLTKHTDSIRIKTLYHLILNVY